MKKQAAVKERIYSIEAKPEQTQEGFKLSAGQIEAAKKIIKEIYRKP
jgi:hypothetical protein